MTRREITNKAGKTLQTLDITYEEIDHIYVPKIVHFVIFGSTDLKKQYDSLITFKKSILNVPIPAEKFNYKKLGLKDGDMFIDKVTNKNYAYNAGNLVKVEKKDKTREDPNTPKEQSKK
jgi:hypothetical protein